MRAWQFLAVAILERAALDLVSPHLQQRQSAKEYIEEAGGLFDTTCDSLNIDPEIIRSRLLSGNFNPSNILARRIDQLQWIP